MPTIPIFLIQLPKKVFLLACRFPSFMTTGRTSSIPKKDFIWTLPTCTTVPLLAATTNGNPSFLMFENTFPFLLPEVFWVFDPIIGRYFQAKFPISICPRPEPILVLECPPEEFKKIGIAAMPCCFLKPNIGSTLHQMALLEAFCLPIQHQPRNTIPKILNIGNLQLAQEFDWNSTNTPRST